MKLKNTSDTVIVCMDYAQGDIPVLIVGRRNKDNGLEIINALKGEEAVDLYLALTVKKEGVK